MHRLATLTAWWADRPGRNPNDDPEKPGSKIGVSTCAIAWQISLSRQVGTPSKRSPPPGLGITTRRTGDGRYVPASRACRTRRPVLPQPRHKLLRGHAVHTRRARIGPDTPQRPAQILRREHPLPQETSRPGMTASSGCAGRPLRSAAVLNGTHRLLPAAGPRPRDGCDHRDQHEQHRFLRLT